MSLVNIKFQTVQGRLDSTQIVITIVRGKGWGVGKREQRERSRENLKVKSIIIIEDKYPKYRILGN